MSNFILKKASLMMYRPKTGHVLDVGQRGDSSLNTTSVKPNVEVPLTEAGLTPNREELLDGIGCRLEERFPFDTTRVKSNIYNVQCFLFSLNVG